MSIEEEDENEEEQEESLIPIRRSTHSPQMRDESTASLTYDLLLPTALFIALGAMGWAVRGCSGFGAMNGCLFAGLNWAVAWWFIAHEPAGWQPRRYASGWIVLALSIGFAVSGNRGWMQWPSFFEGHLQTNTPRGEFVPISRTYGFVWLFIAGVPWAGLGACLLAWCGSRTPLRVRDWALRLGCGIGMAWIAHTLFEHFPEWFLPLYKSLQTQYADLQTNPNLRRLINDNRAAILHLGLYLGFLFYELGRKDWRNVKLILIVGVVNGLGWALFQNWKWAPKVWPQNNFNWWRCWETCGGISIGLAYGLAYYAVNRPGCRTDPRQTTNWPGNPHPNLERFAAYLGLVLGLGFSIKNGLKGWANIYIGREDYWNAILWRIMGPLMLACVLGLALWIRRHLLPKTFKGDLFPHAYGLTWLVLLTQNFIAQLITGPHTVWSETAFAIYYLLLFVISAVIIHHYHCVRTVEMANTDASLNRSGLQTGLSSQHLG